MAISLVIHMELDIVYKVLIIYFVGVLHAECM
jgi:hypothetical protein